MCVGTNIRNTIGKLLIYTFTCDRFEAVKGPDEEDGTIQLYSIRQLFHFALYNIHTRSSVV